MSDITATEAARKFSALLDRVEHDGESYTIVRRGKAIAHLEPAGLGRGEEVKALLQRHTPDKSWSGELEELRAMLEVDERS